MKRQRMRRQRNMHSLFATVSLVDPALVIRNVQRSRQIEKSDDSRKKLEIDSIVIQSPLLKNVLRDVLKDYPGVTTSLSRLIFSAPFKPFVHRRRELMAALNGEYDETTKSHLDLLKGIIYSELKDVITATEDYIKHKVVTYDHIWTIFEPGCIIHASRFGKPVAVRLTDGRFVQHPQVGPCFQLQCDRVDWDGTRFGYGVSTYMITPFEGTKPVTDLECFPLSYHPNEENIKGKLIDRGSLFERFAGYHYKSYKGQALKTTRLGPSLVTVDGRIIIDASAYKSSNPNYQASLRPLDQIRVTTKAQDEDESDDGWYDYDPYNQQAQEDLGDDEAAVKRQRPLKREELLLCTPIIRGFALRPKLWLEFFVDSVSDIVFDSDAFNSLVLPDGHKSLILAIAQAQAKNKDVFDDVIAGKGKGIIMLLSGGPGIGKTLTAESVAEHMQVPLYAMSAADLGVNSSEIEHGLSRVLSMVAKWHAVLLLDECDVYLEARSTHDLDRNRIVSIFLRTLEYYEGFLFLTTNRVKQIDEAFNSRIHFRLAYPDLDAHARRKVWTGFLDRQLGGHDVTDEELSRLESLEINGRVIKNVLKSAALLASHKNEKLGFRHLETVLTIDGHEI